MTTEKRSIGFTEGKIFLRLLLFVLPIVATNLLQTLYHAADMMVVSLSDQANAVGAIGTTGSFINLVVNIFIGFSVGTNVTVARSIGAGDSEGAQKAVHTSLIMALMFGVLGSALGLLISRPVLTAMGNTGSLLDLAVRYTYIYFCGVPFLAITNYLIAIFRAKGDAKTPLVVLAAAGILNVLLNLFFVVIVGLSVEGVALATMISNVASFVVLIFKLWKDKDYTTFSPKKLRIDKTAFRNIIYIGLPAGIQGALFSLSNMLIQSSVVTVNNNVCPPESDYQPIVNGSAAAANIEGFVYTSMNAVYQASITFTSQNVGAKKLERVKPILYNCYLLTTLIGLIMSASVFLFRVPLLSLYGITAGEAGSLEELAMQTATTRFWYITLPYFLCGLMEVGSGVLRGLGKSLLSTSIALVGSCLLRVVWLLTVFPLYLTLEVIFVCYPITWFMTAATSFTVIHILMGKIRKRKYANEKNPT